ncbi:MAG: O-antigen ligase family protein [Phycisphaerae bacterium]
MNTPTRTYLARAALAVLLLVLCCRMTINEGIDDGFIGTLSTQLSGLPPAVEVTCAAAMVLLCAGIGLLVETPRRWWQWASLSGITALSALAFADSIPAANHFAALVGACDFSMNLLAGWTIALLCTTPNRRALAISVLASLGAVLAFKGLYQHYVEIPQTVNQFTRHPNRWLASIGIRPGSSAVRLFISRLKSREVTGFGSDNDQFGEALIPLILLSLMLSLAWWWWRKPAADRVETRKASRHRGGRESAADAAQTTLIMGCVWSALVLVGLGLVLCFTCSKGSIAATVLCIIAMLVGLALSPQIGRIRYRLFALLVMEAAVGAAALIACGLAVHGLPTKDLLFRWEYWNGAVGIIIHHIWHGVGLNNFGYYYTRYKWPSAPEDVKDPHNVLVRIASGLGLPAAIIFTLLLGLVFYLIFRPPTGGQTGSRTPPILAIVGFVAAWWMCDDLSRMVGAGKAIPYILEFSILYAAVAIIGLAVVCQLLSCMTPEYRRKIEIALALGAGGMLLYDQINLALVTGSVAMLFWAVLGMAQPLDSPAPEEESSSMGGDGGVDRRGTIAARLWGGGFAAASLALVVGVITPMVTGRLVWDTMAWAQDYRIDISHGRMHHALEDVNHILLYDRRSQAWLERKISVMEELGENPRAATLRLLHLNTTDARVRIPPAMTPASGLTLPERIAELKLAVRLNNDLPKTEVTRISPRHIAAIEEMIKNLESQLKQKPG